MSSTVIQNIPKNAKHSAFKQLPIVDVSDLYSESFEDRLHVAKYLDKATRQAGFFYLRGHHISPFIIESLKDATKSYFSRSHEEKMQHYIGLSDNHSGYVPRGEEQFYSVEEEPNDKPADLKEAYDIGPESSSLMERFTQEGRNQWPEDGQLKDAVTAYYNAIEKLSKKLFSCFALALGLDEGHFDKHLTIPPSQLRLIHYFDNPEAKENDTGIGAHTDYEFFTILLPTSPGLQAMNGAGEWIDIPLLEDCFIINIGDMMELVSSGRYMATSHRVQQVKEERYSFPFFASLDYHTLIQPITNQDKSDNSTAESLICGDHLLAQTIQTFSYLKQRLHQGEITLPEDSKSLSSFGHIASQTL